MDQALRLTLVMMRMMCIERSLWHMMSSPPTPLAPRSRPPINQRLRSLKLPKTTLKASEMIARVAWKKAKIKCITCLIVSSSQSLWRRGKWTRFSLTTSSISSKKLCLFSTQIQRSIPKWSKLLSITTKKRRSFSLMLSKIISMNSKTSIKAINLWMGLDNQESRKLKISKWPKTTKC